MANKALTVVKWGEVVVAEADLSSWDSTNFTLNWTTNDVNPFVVHYIAIGGSDVSAKVVDWTMGTATATRRSPASVSSRTSSFMPTADIPSRARYPATWPAARSASG